MAFDGGAVVKLSVVIPAHNEEGSIEATVRALTAALDEAELSLIHI